MNKKLVKEFLIITFVIMLIFWGGCALISQIFNLTINNIFLRIMHIIGGFSPTIASYISLKKNNKVKNLKEWLKKIFDIKHNIWTYVLVILFVLIYYVLGCAINGFEFGAPIFMLIVILPMMLFGGGNEEVGWRMILQPELEKKFGFHIATIFTSIIWWLWHLPIFFIRGTANAKHPFPHPDAKPFSARTNFHHSVTDKRPAILAPGKHRLLQIQFQPEAMGSLFESCHRAGRIA